MKIIEFLVVVLLFLVGFFLDYSQFSVCFSDDVAFNYGKAKMKKRKGNTLKKFLFIDIKDYIITWHYICFWIYIITFLPMVIFIILYVFEVSWARIVGAVFILLHYGSVAAASFAYWPLYRGNRIRNRQKYRKNNPK